MPDDNPIIDKAAAAVGAGPLDADPATSGAGPLAPAKPSNKPPVVEPTAEEKAATDKAAADKAEADRVAAAAAVDAPLDTKVWGDTSDAVGNSVLSLLQNSGMTPEEAKAMMYDAVLNGDVTKIDKAALVAKVGNDKATLILAGAENFLARSKTKAEAIVSEVHTSVGGKDNWATITSWAQSGVPAETLTEYRDMIDKGGAQARFAAKELAALYNADDKNTSLGEADITGDSVAVTTGRSTNKATYVAEMEAAHKKGASEATINEIKAARNRGRATGI